MHKYNTFNSFDLLRTATVMGFLHAKNSIVTDFLCDAILKQIFPLHKHPSSHLMLNELKNRKLVLDNNEWNKFITHAANQTSIKSPSKNGPSINDKIRMMWVLGNLITQGNVKETELIFAFSTVFPHRFGPSSILAKLVEQKIVVLDNCFVRVGRCGGMRRAYHSRRSIPKKKTRFRVAKGPSENGFSWRRKSFHYTT